MSSKGSQMQAKTFVAEVKDKLAAGRATLSWLVAAYNWGAQHLAEIKRSSPGYEHGWLREQIRATFRVDPEEYMRAAAKLGGGRAAPLVKRGERILQDAGLKTGLRAAKILTDQEAEAVRQAWTEGKNGEDLSSMVRERVEARNQEQKVFRVSYKLRCEQLLAENAALKREVEILRELLARHKTA